jgi:hypothetical protein
MFILKIILVKPTKTLKGNCTIPFDFNGRANYFCVANPIIYKCDIGDEIFDDCDRGKIISTIRFELENS